MARPRALVVEDAPEFVVLVRRLLENEGFDVLTAGDGERGVAMARSEQPEMVLLDVSLPGIDGFEVCRRIREFSDTYIVMVTARVEELDKVVGLTVGADDRARPGDLPPPHGADGRHGRGDVDGRPRIGVRRRAGAGGRRRD